MKGRFVAMNNVNKRKGKIFIIVIILVIVIWCVGYYKIINNNNKQSENSDKQSSNNTDKEEGDKNNNTKVDFDFNKLKTVTSIEQEITYSWFGCPPKAITYYISVNSTNKEDVYNQTVFSLNYANANNILLVQYNKKGYASHFNSDE